MVGEALPHDAAVASEGDTNLEVPVKVQDLVRNQRDEMGTLLRTPDQHDP